MRFVVFGCGRVGSELAYRLYQNGHEVVVVDQTREAFNRLPADFRGRTVDGDLLSEDVMMRADIAHADGLAAVTSSDAVNMVIAHAARTIYGLSNVVVRNYDPALRPVLEVFALQSVSSTSWGTQRIEEILTNSAVRTVFSAGNGEVEIYEIRVTRLWAGKTIQDLLRGIPDCLPVAVTRHGHSLLPENGQVLEENDLLAVSASAQGCKALCERVEKGREA